MTDHFQQCPSNLQLCSYGPRRFCGRKTNGNGCDSVMIPVGGQPYTEVHEKVVAYQYASPDAFHVGGNPGIDGAYVDGISITYGQSPRRHIWTLAAGLHSYKNIALTLVQALGMVYLSQNLLLRITFVHLAILIVQSGNADL